MQYMLTNRSRLKHSLVAVVAFLSVSFLGINFCPNISVVYAHEHKNDNTHLSVVVTKPILFDVDAKDEIDNVPAIKPWKTIVLDKDYRGAWLVAGDVDGDGEADVVCCRTGSADDDHYTASAVAQRLDGSVIWKWGDPKNQRAGLGSDVACQIYDWDGDGTSEVVLSTYEDGKAWLVELDGPTGKEKRRFQIPNGSTDCIVFCNLSGNKRATDVLVKTRYTQIWAYNYDGEQLWTSHLPGGQRTAHSPQPVDLDHDGKDEIIAGFATLHSDGTLLWAFDEHDPVFEKGNSLSSGHQDCARVFTLAKHPSDTRIVCTFCSGERIAMVNGEGKILWNNHQYHFESVDIGKVCTSVPGRQIVADIPYAPPGKKPIWIFDEKGNLLGQIMTYESRFHGLLDWEGKGVEAILVGDPPALYDGTTGRKTAKFDMPLPPGETVPQVDPGNELYICWTGDMTGDGVPDVVYGTNPGTVVYIYRNEKGIRPDGGSPLGSRVNFTLY